MNKYNAKKTKVDGIVFDSRREAEVYRDLKLQKKTGFVKDFTRQAVFHLIRPPGGVKYIADFLVTKPDGKQEVWEVKGVETPVFKIKAKFFRKLFPNIPLIIVK